MRLPIVYRPCNTTIMTQKYGVNPSYYPTFGGHEGIDTAVSMGWPYYAVADGLVIHSSDRIWSDPTRLSDYGFHCTIEHNIDGVKFRSHYAHSDGRLPQVGEHVSAGAIVGYSANTGRSSGYHLHFAILTDEQTSNLNPSVMGYFTDPTFVLNYPIPEDL